jgi:hypothetical protein
MHIFNSLQTEKHAHQSAENMHLGHHNNQHKYPACVLYLGLLGPGLVPFGPAVPLAWCSNKNMGALCPAECSNSKRYFPNMNEKEK